MRSDLIKIFAPPVFENEEKTRTAVYVNGLAIASVPMLMLYLILRQSFQGVQPVNPENIAIIVLIMVMVAAWYFSKAGYVIQSAYAQVIMFWITGSVYAYSAGTVLSSGFVSYFVAMLLAGLLLGLRAAVIVAIISSISGFSLAYAQSSGMIQPLSETDLFGYTTEITVLFAFGALFTYLTINGLQSAVRKANKTAEELQTSNQELSGLRDDLEKRVQERTAELEKQTIQLQTVSSVARAIASVQDMDQVLLDISKLVSEKFGYYHTGIFLLDENRDFATLRASSSDAGRKMVARQFRIKLDTNSILGYAMLRSEPRIALNLEPDTDQGGSYRLPATRSELTLPLQVGGNTIGALDVQTTEKNAFTQDEIKILTTLTDQISVAIENARLFSETSRALKEAEKSFEKYIRQEWLSFSGETTRLGYHFDGEQAVPLEKGQGNGQDLQLPTTGFLSQSKPTGNLTIPLRFRGQIIGLIEVKPKNRNRAWSSDDLTLLEAAAERAVLALENARLVESSRKRAIREQVIGEISSRIGQSSNLEIIMQTAVEELGRKIGGLAEVSFEIK